MGEPGEAARERRERQAAALRANLRRRKQQARARDAAEREPGGCGAAESGSCGDGADGAERA